MPKESTKSKSQYRMPGKLWKLLKKHLPKPAKTPGPGRPRVSNWNIMHGWHLARFVERLPKEIDYEKEWFGVSSSVLHKRYQTWQEQGLFEKLFKIIVKYYARECRIRSSWYRFPRALRKSFN